MTKILLISLLTIPFLGISQITLNQKDDFEGFTTQNWTKTSSSLPNENIITGGPQGTDDNYLRVRSSGDAGASSQLVTFNNAQWAGNYITAGVTYISMDVRNSGTNIIFLRLSFTNTAWTNDPKWSSINPIAVIPGEGWKTIVFPIAANALSRLGHTNSYNGDFNNISELRILHNDAPAWDGDPIEAILDIDNIQAKNNNLEIVDLNQLKQQIKILPNPSSDFIKIDQFEAETRYGIYDMTGKLIKNGIYNSENHIDIQNFNRGLYLLKLASGQSFKFVKE